MELLLIRFFFVWDFKSSLKFASQLMETRLNNPNLSENGRQQQTRQTLILTDGLFKHLISYKSTNIRLICDNYRAAFVCEWVPLQIRAPEL